MVSETISEHFKEDGHRWMPNYGKCSDSFWPSELKKNILQINSTKYWKNSEKKLQVPLNYLVFKSFDWANLKWGLFKKCTTLETGVKKSHSPTPGASNFHIWASWNNQLYARRASKNIYTSLSIFAYLLIFIYVICCLISSNVLFIQPLAFCRNWEQRR
jgi:hypothetical protein